MTHGMHVCWSHGANSTSSVRPDVLSVIQSFGRHFTYPHMTIAGEDLLVVMRASADTGQMDVTANYYVRLVSSI